MIIAVRYSRIRAPSEQQCLLIYELLNGTSVPRVNLSRREAKVVLGDVLYRAPLVGRHACTLAVDGRLGVRWWRPSSEDSDMERRLPCSLGARTPAAASMRCGGGLKALSTHQRRGEKAVSYRVELALEQRNMAGNSLSNSKRVVFFWNGDVHKSATKTVQAVADGRKTRGPTGTSSATRV